MSEIVRIDLDNEMDLILAHKKSMKIAELCGLAVSAQTRFATAVSEIARCAITNGEDSSLKLSIESLSGGKKEISAKISDRINISECSPEAYQYATRIVKNVSSNFSDGFHTITIAVEVPYSRLLSDARVSSFVDYFKREPPLSAYDEIRKKNIQLIELADKLTESESNYRQLTDSLPFLVFSVSKNNQVYVANKPAKTFLEKNLTEFSNEQLSHFFHKNDLDKVLNSWNSVKSRQSKQTFQARVLLQNEPIWHEVNMVPNTDELQNNTGFIVSLVNIHAQKLVEETLKNNEELKQAQKELQLSNEMLQSKNRELEQFAYIASHDLQEPLRKIRNFISLASRRTPKEVQEQLYHDRIENAAERMSHLVRDILNYSTLMTKADYQNTDLNKIMIDVLEDLALPIQEKNAVVNFEQLPIINAIPSQMNQLFYNLLNNAIKFSETTPTVKISYTITSTGENFGLKPQPYHKIEIQDNGIGIEEPYFERIFSMFQRLHPQTMFHGTGIGLSICRRIVENHSGTIKVTSSPGQGSTFYIYLPKI